MQLQNSYLRNLLVDSNSDIGRLDLVNCLRYLHLQKVKNICIKYIMKYYQKGENQLVQNEFSKIKTALHYLEHILRRVN